MTEDSTRRPVFHVLLHTPGPQWQDGVSFQDQPGVGLHVQYMAGLLQQGLLVMGGPFLDDTGGMMISRAQTIEDALRIANKDPAVTSGLLRVTVRPWMVPMQDVKPC